MISFQSIVSRRRLCVLILSCYPPSSLYSVIRELGCGTGGITGCMIFMWYSSTINTEEQNGVKQYSTSGFNCGFSALSPLSLYALWNSCWIPAVSFGSVTSSLVKSQDFRRHEQRKEFISWPLMLSMSFCPYVHTRCRWVDLEEFESWSAALKLAKQFFQSSLTQSLNQYFQVM